MTDATNPKPVRRIVTGHDETGKAVVVIDGAAPNQRVRAATGLVSTLLWVTEESPVDIASNADRADRPSPVAPPPKGSILRVVDFPPAGDTSGISNEAMLKEMGIDHGHGGKPARHAFTHRITSRLTPSSDRRSMKRRGACASVHSRPPCEGGAGASPAATAAAAVSAASRSSAAATARWTG
jgi:hypothetical protein